MRGIFTALILCRAALAATTWTAMYMDETKVGYSYTTREVIAGGDDAGGTYIEDYSTMQLSRAGMPMLTSARHRETYDAAGRMTAATCYTISGTDVLIVNAALAGDVLEVERIQGLSVGKRYLEGGLVGTLGFSLVMDDLGPGESLDFSLYSSDYSEVIRVTYTRGVPGEVTFGGETFPGRVDEVNFAGMPRESYYDAAGEWLGTLLPGGTSVRPAADEADAKAGLTWVDPAATTALFPEGDIPNPRGTERLVLLIEGTSPPPADPFQRVETAGDGAWRVTVRNRPFPTYPPPEPFPEPEYHRALEELAEALTVEGDPYNTYLNIVGWVGEYLRESPVTLELTPAETLVQRRGDCTEHAALVSDLCRRAGIPAITVIGLVSGVGGKLYYHAWNEAYVDGLWRASDAFLDEEVADAARLVLLRDPTGVERTTVLGRVTGVVVEEVEP
ncbi:MAG TPA: transglutaminase-like domain-containing protein [bacterium]|nr:transglutaminase-like domain-containing protein [bacterium]